MKNQLSQEIILQKKKDGKNEWPEIRLDGIFHPDSSEIFANLSDYQAWRGSLDRYSLVVGILTHHDSIKKNKAQVEAALICELESRGVGVIPVFSYSTAEEQKGVKSFLSVIRDYFSQDGELKIDGLINFQMQAATGNDHQGDLFAQSVDVFKTMNVPVFKALVSRLQNQQEWQENPAGLATEIAWAFTGAERLGMIEPIIIGTREKADDLLKIVPLPERITRLVGRVIRRLELKKVAAANKKVVLMLHCAPCAGVEATLGAGVGLDVFESVVRILKTMAAHGYPVTGIPDDGAALKEMLLKRKAYQDFRWTTVEDIVAAGGDLYRMSLDGSGGYHQFYQALDLQLQTEMESAWGEPPGQGMVYENKLIITGLDFGAVKVMIQPKRGCYGSKCTGEVCKILHDPSCPPPHQYLATYRYIDAVLKAHAVVHVGTGGSLEHLPGKTNGLSKHCWPDVVIGDLPNFYCYNAAIGVEGMGAKRRNYAVVLDYLPSCLHADYTRIELIGKLGNYLTAVAAGSQQVGILKTELDAIVAAVPEYLKIIEREENYNQGIVQLKNRLSQSLREPVEQKNHIWGELPDISQQVSYLKESIDASSLLASLMKKDNPEGYHEQMLQKIASLLDENADAMTEPQNQQNMEEAVLENEIKESKAALLTVIEESQALIKALSGDYLEPGLSGTPRDGLERIMPTGRNFYLMDTKKIPTRAAYAIGEKMAFEMLKKHQQETGDIPEKVAMNMISTDISMTGGEQLSQVLALLGVVPVWNETGSVMDLEVRPLAELGRPRIDVMVRISGVLRDSYPDLVAMMDRAVQLAAERFEPETENFVRRNTNGLITKLRQTGELSQVEAFRRATIRIFGDKPGTYGSGVDLALKASAWDLEDELAKVFTAFSGYAYGEGLVGGISRQEFVENIKAAEVVFETTAGNRYDLLSSSYSASVIGGFNMVKNQLTQNELKQYHGTSNHQQQVVVSSLEEELKRIMEMTVFNPLWNRSVIDQGAGGAAEIMRRAQTVFSWKCTTKNITDNAVDELVQTYLGDPQIVAWLGKENRFALEELSRRFLELRQRGKWQPSPEALKILTDIYMKVEGDMEEMMEESRGDYLGGGIEIIGHEQVETWNRTIREVDALFNSERREK